MSESDPKDGKHRMSADDFMAEARALTIEGMRQRAESRKPSALDLMKDMLQQRAAASDSIEQSLERTRALLGDNAAPAREPSPAAPVESPPPPVKPARLSLDEAMRVAVAEREAAKQASAADEPRIIGGRKLWKLADAVAVIAVIPGFGIAPATLLKRALRAAVAGALIVRDLGDGDIRRADNLSEFLGEWLFAEDFNDWLASAGFGEQYRLPDEVAQNGGFPAAPTEPQASASASTEAVPAPAVKPAALPQSSAKGIQRCMLVMKYRNSWPTIETDLKDAATNGLSAAAKAGSRGWREADAVAWAKANNRFLEAPEVGTLGAVMANGLTARRHKLAG